MNSNTADGSEIQRSPVEVGSEYPIIYRESYISGGCWGSESSTVSQKPEVRGGCLTRFWGSLDVFFSFSFFFFKGN